jgi:hypothetical protein
MSSQISPMLLCPIFEFIVISALSLESPSQKPLYLAPSWLNTRIGRTHHALSKILEAMCCMWCPFYPEIEIL